MPDCCRRQRYTADAMVQADRRKVSSNWPTLTQPRLSVRIKPCTSCFILLVSCTNGGINSVLSAQTSRAPSTACEDSITIPNSADCGWLRLSNEWEEKQLFSKQRVYKKNSHRHHTGTTQTLVRRYTQIYHFNILHELLRHKVLMTMRRMLKESSGPRTIILISSITTA
jgi:hypothetical protein